MNNFADSNATDNGKCFSETLKVIYVLLHRLSNTLNAVQ